MRFSLRYLLYAMTFLGMLLGVHFKLHKQNQFNELTAYGNYRKGRLVELDMGGDNLVGYNETTDDDLRRLSRHFAHLESFKSDYALLSNEGLTYLLQAPHLKRLSLYAPNLTDACFVTLGQMRELESFSLESAAIDGSGLRYLTKLPRLKVLELTRVSIRDDAWKTLALMPELNGLILYDTQISDAELIHFDKMKKLKYLGLESSLVTYQGIMNMKLLGQLQLLILSDARITAEQRQELQSSYPKLEIRRYRLFRPWGTVKIVGAEESAP